MQAHFALTGPGQTTDHGGTTGPSPFSPWPLALICADPHLFQVKKLQAELQYANKRITSLFEEHAVSDEDDSVYKNISRVISPALIGEGDTLRAEMASAVGAKAAAAAPSTAADVGEGRINQMARTIERVLFGGGGGSLERTRLLWAAVVERPAIQRLLTLTEPSGRKQRDAARLALAHAKSVLAELKTGGTRTGPDHLAFETIVAALFPDDAKEQNLMRTLQSLLGVEWDALHRAELINASRNEEVELQNFTAAVAAAAARERRKDFRGEGRRLCVQ